MISVLVILVFSVYLAFFFPLETKPRKKEEKSPKYTAQMKKLWQIAQTSMRDRKPLRAEKALLTILKFDEKNAAAYNRLGILYAKSQKYDEAVECFEIAQSLDNNPASIHNVGLIYLEMGKYEKAAMAFAQAIALEGDVPARHVALAKAEEKLGNAKKAISALEDAYELDPKVATLREILSLYEGMGDTEAVTATAARIEEQIVRDNAAKAKKATARTRRVATKRSVVMPKKTVRRTRTVRRSGTVATKPGAAQTGARPSGVRAGTAKTRTVRKKA